jgi:hypothetical protein
MPAAVISTTEEASAVTSWLAEQLSGGLAEALRAPLELHASPAAGYLEGRGSTLDGVKVASLPQHSTAGSSRFARHIPIRSAEAIAGLTAAVGQAGEMLGPLARADVARAIAAFTRDLSIGRTIHLRPRSDAFAPEADLRARARALDRNARATASAQRGSVRRALAAQPRVVDLLGRALDRYLPELLAPTGRTSPAGTSADGCDLVDRLPTLCVGSEADNTYISSAALLVDLGGNDTYRNSAGGAPFASPESPALVPVSLNVDISGNDVYAGTAADWSLYDDHPLTVGAGVGATGAVGIAVDVAGDDRYSAEAPAPAAAATSAALAQGAGFGGFGALVDLAGADSYSISGRPGIRDTVLAIGQGAGYQCNVGPTQPDPVVTSGCGTGLLLDRGEGKDTYSIDAGMVTGDARQWRSGEPFTQACRRVVGQGAAIVGTGILHDDGGEGSFSVSAAAEALPENGFHNIDFYGIVQLPELELAVQGYGELGGVGALLTGPGPTSYDASLSISGPSRSLSASQGYGFFEGAGYLRDLGGDDSFAIGISGRDERDVLVSDDCTTIDPAEGATIRCPFASVRVWSVVPLLGGQGWGGYQTGVGALVDDAGDDAYLARHGFEMDARVVDGLTDPDGPALVETQLAAAPVMAQGFAIWDSAGSLVDRSGSDRYRIDSRAHASTTARSLQSEDPPVVTGLALPRNAYHGGQGAGRQIGVAAGGLLLDLEGATDSFYARSEATIATEPDSGNALRFGMLWPLYQGAGVSGYLAALGEQPRLMSSPSQGVCGASPEQRGFGAWLECPHNGATAESEVFDQTSDGVLSSPFATSRHAGGFAPHATGENVDLVFAPETPVSGVEDGSLEVSATLSGPGAAPLVGENVLFDLQFTVEPLVESPLALAWYNGFEAEAVTDERGIARARLPLSVSWLHLMFGSRPEWRYRLMATYDGSIERALRPRHVVRPFSLDAPGG